MKIDLSGRTGRFARRTLSDFSEKMILLLTDMPLEEISVRKICDICNYPRSTFYNYFDDIYDLMDYCWIVIVKDMNLEQYMNIPAEDRTKEIFLRLYDYLDGYRPQIRKILSKNSLNGKCMSSLRLFMRGQIKDIVSTCPYTKDFSLREDVMVDYYAVTIEMLLEKCFLEKIPLSKEDAVQSLGFLLGTIEKEAHRK